MASPTSEPPWTIRRATPEDLEATYEVFAAVAAERIYIGSEPPLDRDDRLRRWRASLEDPKAVTFVADAGGQIVGMGNVSWVGASEIGMAILSEWRGRGIGSALLSALIEWAEENGSHKMELRVWPHNEAALALYEKFGFEREGYLKRHYKRRNGEIWDCIIMGLQLPRRA